MKTARIQILTVTPAMAKKWLERGSNIRKLNARTVAKFVRDIQADKWDFTHQGICLDTDGYLTDGQHRLAAILATKKAQKVVVATNFPTSIMVDAHTRRPGWMTTNTDRHLFAVATPLYMVMRLHAKQPVYPPTDNEKAKIVREYGRRISGLVERVGVPMPCGQLAAATFCLPIGEEKVVEFCRQAKGVIAAKPGSAADKYFLWRRLQSRVPPEDDVMYFMRALKAHINETKLILPSKRVVGRKIPVEETELKRNGFRWVSDNLRLSRSA